MTLLQGDEGFVDAAESQWRAEKLQVFNWGGFHGHAVLDLAEEVTVVSGMSGAGKSTLLDAYTALMMPPTVAFNGASNDSGAGRARSAEQRNVLSYLRGKIDDTLEEGEVIDDVLRGRDAPVWGAVAMTFIKEAGQRFTAVRAYYAAARLVKSSEVTTRNMTIHATFDVRELQEFARIGESNFPARNLKAKWPGLSTHETNDSFSQTLFTKLGIGLNGDGAKALRLLARIQASADIPTVDKLYKELVIEEPDTYVKADKAINHFDQLDDVYQEMITAQQRADLLEPITEAHAALVEAQEAIVNGDELGDVRSDHTSAGLWRLRKHSTLLREAVATNRTEAQQERTNVAELTLFEQSTRSLLEATKKEHREAGGDLLSELALQIDQISATIARREDVRRRFITATQSLGLPLATRDEFDAARDAAAEFGAEYVSASTELGGRRDAMLRDSYPMHERAKEIRQELTSLKTRTGRIDEHFHEMRLAAAQASGLPISDLPFVAELIDVLPEEADWRVAIETALHSSARTMLVPMEYLAEFSRAIDPIELRGRLTFQGVRRNVPARSAARDPRRVAGKLQFKESPYRGWVLDHVADGSRNALCVDSPDDLGGDDLRITSAGQTRRGARGAHGRQSQRNVIGFDNVDLRGELAAELASTEVALVRLNESSAGIARELQELEAKRSAFQRVLETNWSEIDLAGVTAEQAELEKRRNDIRDNNDVLAALDQQIIDLETNLDETQRQRHASAESVTRLDLRHAELVDIEDRINPALTFADSDDTIVLRDDLVAGLDRIWDSLVVGDPVTPATFDRYALRIADVLKERVAQAQTEVARMTQHIEGIFRRYLAQWPEPNLMATVDFYDDFAAILASIVESGLRERRDEWRRRLLQWSGEHLQQLATSLTTAVEDIENRLYPINQILRDLPFGATDDRLQIDLRKLSSEAVTRFRKELTAHARIATTGLDEEALEKRFKDLQRFMAQIRRKDDLRLPRNLMDRADRDRLLDVRRHVEITAQRVDGDGEVLSVYSTLRGKSGGEMQELIAFIVGSALRFQLGDQERSRPTFAPVFLDEGFIKADGQFTGRAVQAWRKLGFQLIVGAPIDKAPALEAHAELVVMVTKNLTTHRSYIADIRRHDDVTP
ncbi:ATP-binding protein [Microbacterium mitrae]|uniref:AAA family ATPase n=1 Tax=Microbacterium mitrae TaxID=664640 RepID=A0A5C8HLJ1_9MICO|nr:SbcC/MukB-like Walker B domain-containing protein [Microbacterium mitrae]TXK04115.1 hypothetical protein FVP60_10135 [Microbacterium mitrae]